MINRICGGLFNFIDNTSSFSSFFLVSSISRHLEN
jgi:hypothetical protein